MSRKSALLALLLFCCARQLSAQTIVVLSEDGRQVWFAPSSSAAALKVDRVVRLGTNPGGPQLPPMPGLPLTELAATWRTKVADYRSRDEHRQALAGMYLVLSQQIRNGSFEDLGKLKRLTTEFRNILLRTDRSKWDRWGRDVGEYLSSHVGSLPAASSAYLEIAAGLDSAFLEIPEGADSTEAISEQLLAFLMMILKLLLQWLEVGV